MLDHDEWKASVVDTGATLCPACESTNITCAPCAVGALTIHQEYVCETACRHTPAAWRAAPRADLTPAALAVGPPNLCLHGTSDRPGRILPRSKHGCRQAGCIACIVR